MFNDKHVQHGIPHPVLRMIDHITIIFPLFTEHFYWSMLLLIVPLCPELFAETLISAHFLAEDGLGWELVDLPSNVPEAGSRSGRCIILCCRVH